MRRSARLAALLLALGGPAQGEPRLVRGDFPTAAASSPEAAARGFLDAHAAELGLGGVDLEVSQVRTGRAGKYVRFGERAAGVTVFDAEVIVLVDRPGHVRAVNLAHRVVVG